MDVIFTDLQAHKTARDVHVAGQGAGAAGKPDAAAGTATANRVGRVAEGRRHATHDPRPRATWPPGLARTAQVSARVQTAHASAGIVRILARGASHRGDNLCGQRVSRPARVGPTQAAVWHAWARDCVKFKGLLHGCRGFEGAEYNYNQFNF